MPRALTCKASTRSSPSIRSRSRSSVTCCSRRWCGTTRRSRYGPTWHANGPGLRTDRRWCCGCSRGCAGTTASRRPRGTCPRRSTRRASPPQLERFIVVVVDEPTTKLAALTAGELDFAGILPAHAGFVRRRPDLVVLDYPLIFPYGIVFNTRRPPFDDVRVRRAVGLALDRQEIVDGYLYGFGTVADGPVSPDVPGYVPGPAIPANPDSARRLLGGRTIAFDVH